MSKKIIEYLHKFLINIRLDIEFIITPRIKLKDKLIYIFNKYYSIATNKRQIKYLGNNFYYDNRLVPAIMQVYPKEIIDVDNAIKLETIKTCLDIGANIGQFAYTLKKFFPKIEIYSFEPIKDSFNLLQKNLSILEKTKIFNLAIGIKKEIREFYYSPDASAEASFIEENTSQNYLRKNIKKIKVRVINLSNKNLKKLDMPNKFDLIKIDVEGAELEVLKSIKNINFKYLFIEVSTNRIGSSVEDISNFIKNELKKKAKLVYYHIPEKKSPAANALFKI